MSASGSGEPLVNSTGPCPPFGDKIYAKVAAVAAAPGFISFLANCFVIFIIILFKKWRFFSQRLILYLAISAAIMSIGIVLQRTDYENQTKRSYFNFCIFAGFLNQVSIWMVINSVTSIVIFITLRIFTSISPSKCEPFLIFYILILPLMLNWIPFINLTYGKAGVWCWIRSQKENCEQYLFGRILQPVLLYIPLYVISSVLVVVYIVILIKLHCTRKQWRGKLDFETERFRRQIKQEIRPLMIYPLIFFIFNIVPLVNCIYTQVHPESHHPALWLLAGIAYPVQGGVIAITFSLDPETRRRLTAANFRAAFSECFRNKNIAEYPIQYVDTDMNLKEQLLAN